MQFLAGLTSTYEDVALERMQRVRRAVLTSREFLDGIQNVYLLAKAAYLAQILTTSSRRARKKQLEYVRRNGKTVVVLISGNQSLLGNVVLTSYKVFLQLVNEVNADCVILGNLGRYLAQSAKPNIKFKYFEMDDYVMREEQIAAPLATIGEYERILVVYPKFESVLRQEPAVDDISGGVTITREPAKIKKYYFEPSAQAVMEYFETAVITTLFRQKILESTLSRLAARLAIMDHATKTAGVYINTVLREQKTVLRRIENRKLLDAFAGISIWQPE